MIIEDIIQALTYNTHVNSDGSNIGGVDPLVYGVTTIPGVEQELLLSTSGNSDKTGKGYPAFMWYPAVGRTILPNTGNIAACWKYMLGGSLAGVNVVETDVIFVKTGADGKKFKYNGSFQRQSTTGLMIVNEAGEWVEASGLVDDLQLNNLYELDVNYELDTVGHKLTYVSTQTSDNGLDIINITTPGVAFPVGQEWPDGGYVQCQLGSMPNGIAWQLRVSSIKLRYW